MDMSDAPNAQPISGESIPVVRDLATRAGERTCDAMNDAMELALKVVPEAQKQSAVICIAVGLLMHALAGAAGVLLSIINIPPTPASTKGAMKAILKQLAEDLERFDG